MENNNTFVTAKFKEWNIISLLPLVIGIIWLVISVILIADDDDFVPLLFIALPPIGVGFLLKYYFSQLTLTITNDWIFSKRWFNKKTTMPIKKVSYVDTGIFNRISIHSDGGRLVFWGCENDNEVFAAITSKFQN